MNTTFITHNKTSILNITGNFKLHNIKHIKHFYLLKITFTGVIKLLFVFTLKLVLNLKWASDDGKGNLNEDVKYPILIASDTNK